MNQRASEDILIVGGGIAGVEALLALADLGDRELRISVIATQPVFTLRPQSLGVPWGGDPLHVDLEELCASTGARFCLGTVTTVDAAGARVQTAAGAAHAYGRLLLAPGARQALPYPFSRVLGFGRLPRTLASAATGSVAIVVPPGTSWTLPAYELALLTAARHPDREVRVISPESTPLEAFGPHTGVAVSTFLAEHGVIADLGQVVAVGTDLTDLADTVIALPLLHGPRIDGLPVDACGFVRVDDHTHVAGLEHVYAAGDATGRTLKQGGLAAQQADTAAAVILRSLGAAVPLPAAGLVLRGKLTAPGGDELFLRRALDEQDDGETATTPLWMPPSVVCAWRLARWLTARQPDPALRDLGHVAAAPVTAAPAGA